MDVSKLLASHKIVFEKLNLQAPELLGNGMEGFVYTVSDNKILKIWRDTHCKRNHLSERKKLYEIVGKQL